MMLTFTDSGGSVSKLHNAKSYPGSRFANWHVNSEPFGDSASRLSDGLPTVISFRDDFGVTFELPLIPSRRSENLVLWAEDFSQVWAAVGTPTRTPAAHTRSGITLDLIGDDSGAAEEYYQQAIVFTGNGTKALSIYVRAGTITPGGGSVFQLNDETAPANRFNANIVLSSGVPVISNLVGTYFGYEYHSDGLYRLLFSSLSSLIAANTNRLLVVPAIGAANQGNIYAGGVQAENNAYPTPYMHTRGSTRVGISLYDIADHLCYHLKKGGTCTIHTNDAAGSIYTTCALQDGKRPQLVLSDKENLEYTLTLPLLNVAASPSRMSCHYADQ